MSGNGRDPEVSEEYIRTSDVRSLDELPLGCVCVPLPDFQRMAEAEHQLRDARAKIDAVVEILRGASYSAA